MSSTRVALATAADVWRADTDAELTAAALAAAGVEARPAAWDDPAEDWASYALVVVRSTWDYVPRLEEFLAWADHVDAATDLANPAPVIRWNTDKRYLEALARDGVPVVDTTFLTADEHAADPDGTGRRVRTALADAAGADGHVVVKPTVSAGSKDTVRHDVGDLGRAADHAVALLTAGRDVMVQPYLDAVDSHGETGMVHFGGTFSHAFHKAALLEPGGAPVPGLYAEERIGPRSPTEAERALAEATLDAVRRHCGPAADELLYARVDVVPDGAGRPVLLEVELAEPSFFLGTDPGAATRFAQAVRRRLERTAGPGTS